MSTLGDDLDRLALLTKREKVLSRRLKEANARRVALEHDVYDRMVGEGWEPGKSTLNRNGVKFRPTNTTFAVIQDADKLREWLLDQDGDDLADAGIVEDSFKKGELNRIVRTKLDNGEQLPPGLGYFDRTGVHKSGIMGQNDDGGTDE